MTVETRGSAREQSNADCSRAWQAEAIADGRLSSEDAASFRRHAATCDVCTAEVAAFAALRQVCARLPGLEINPLERRRQRNELLRRANELVVKPKATAWPAPLAVGLALGVCLALFLLRAPSPEPATEHVVPSFQLVSSHNALFHTLERGATLRVSARRGRFELVVDKLHEGQRFLLVLPDGELEVQGTRFVVDVDDDRTQRVAVSEGRVALRLHGETTRVLSAGDIWVSEASAARVAGTPSQAPAREVVAPGSAREQNSVVIRPNSPQATGTARATRAALARSMRADAAASRRTMDEEAAESAVGRETANGAGLAFAAAMAAFSAGDYGRAELLLSSFARRYPDDARVEDTLFLRAQAHARRGNRDASRALARLYRERYPQGLRFKEAERLLR